MKPATSNLLSLAPIIVAIGCAEPLGPEPARVSPDLTAAPETRIVGNGVFVMGINADGYVAVNASIAADGTVAGRVMSPAYGSGGNVEHITHLAMNRIWCIQYRDDVNTFDRGPDEPERYVTLRIHDVGDGVSSFDEVGLSSRAGIGISYESCDRFLPWLHEIDRGDFRVVGGD